MIVYTLRICEDRLTKDSKPLDEDAFFSILDHDPFNTRDPALKFKWHPFEISDLLKNSEMKEKYGLFAETLLSSYQIQKSKLVPQDKKFNGRTIGIIQFEGREFESPPQCDKELYAIKLDFGDVRVEVINHSGEKIGEWVPYAWSPLRNELYIFGRDFMPTSEILKTEDVPEKRGRPSDILVTGANCGPSSLAAYLDISTEEAIKYLPIFKQKGWVNPPHIVKALEEMNQEYTHAQFQRKDKKSLSDIISEFGHGLAFTQYFYGKNEKISHTHWVAFDENGFDENGLDCSMVYDVNVWDNPAFGIGDWVPLEEWNKGVEAFVRENFRKRVRYKKFDGYFVRDCISLK